MDVAIGSLVTVICLIAAPLLLVKAGGWAGLHAALPATHFELLGNLTLLRALEFLLPTMLLMLGNQVMYQKFFSAKSEKDARLSVVGWIVGTVILETVIVAIAVIGSALVLDGRSGQAAVRDHSVHGAAWLAGADGGAAAGGGVCEGDFDGFELPVFAGDEPGQ